MKDKIMIHTTARFRWENYGDENLMKRFLTEYWGVYQKDLEKFNLKTTALEACQTLWRLETKYKKAWKGNGYNILVDEHGEHQVITNLKDLANGARGYNSSSVHISWDGGVIYDPETKRFVNTDNRTKKIKAGLLNAIHEVLVWNRDEKQNINLIIGHRDVDPNKDCPCFDAKKEYSWITA